MPPFDTQLTWLLHGGHLEHVINYIYGTCGFPWQRTSLAKSELALRVPIEPQGFL